MKESLSRNDESDLQLNNIWPWIKPSYIYYIVSFICHTHSFNELYSILQIQKPD